MTTTSVYGVRETMAELRELDKELFFQSVREIKKAAAPLAAAIQAGIPVGPPLSGMAYGRISWRRTKVSIDYGGRKRRDRDQWPLLKLSIKDGGAVLFDMAGKNSPDSNLARNLTARFGSPSRAAWRPDDVMRRSAEKAVVNAIGRASEKVNKNLVRRAA